MRCEEVFEVFLDAMEPVKREAKDVKIVAASGSGGGCKTFRPVEYVRPFDDKPGLYFSYNGSVMLSFREGLHGTIMDVMTCWRAVLATDR